jgi:hypothetical protein
MSTEKCIFGTSNTAFIQVIMTFEQFIASIADAAPPPTGNPILTALWHDANGNWTAAHDIAQSREGTATYDRLHAYLHRKEGDRFNADYWYRRAGVGSYAGTLEEEWNDLVTINSRNG